MLLTFYFKITLDLQKSCKDRTKNIPGFPGCSVGKKKKKNLPAMRESQVQSLGHRDPLSEEGNDNPFQSSCLENSTERGDWQATVQGSQRVRHDLAA